MTVNPSAIGSAWFLDGIANLQRRETDTQKQLSSGYSVQDAADAPSQSTTLVSLGASLATFQTWRTNLNRVQAETQTADQALGSAISLLDQARSIGAQGVNPTATANSRGTLAVQIRNIQQQLVALSNTSVEGRYIFAGDHDQSAPYQVDAASATGVAQLVASASTRTIVNPAGEAVYRSGTAQQIFDPVDAAGAPTPDNTFAAIQSLVAALGANDQPGITSAISSLNVASDWVNQQQASYGAAEQRITAEQSNADSQISTLRAAIGGIRDADVVQAATDLSQENIDRSAAYGAQAQIGRKSLFDYLG